jgi:hypothetical protein
MSERSKHGAPTVREGKKKRRPRPLPRWLKEQQDMDEMARRRCLMVLSVLSGERPVTDVIEEAKISRGTYYELEERALRAMLAAMAPGATTQATPGIEAAVKKAAEMEERARRLEVEKRRAERLLLLTRKVVRKGPLTTPGGWPRGRSRRSTSAGKRPSPSSTDSAKTTTVPSPSTPTTTSGDAR